MLPKPDSLPLEKFNELSITNQNDLSDLLQLQKLLYSPNIDIKSLQTLIKDLQEKYSPKEIDHQLILASSLDYSRISILLPFLSKKSLEKVDFIHADQQFLFHLIESNISFPLHILWEKCMHFSKLTDEDPEYPYETDGETEIYANYHFGIPIYLYWNTPVVQIEENLMKKFENCSFKKTIDKYSQTRKKKEIENIIENDDLEQFRALSAVSDFNFNGTITKENLLFEYSSISILSYCIEKNAIKCFKYAFINGADPFQKSTIPIVSYHAMQGYTYLEGENEDIWDSFGFAGATGNIQIIKILQESSEQLSKDLIMGCTKFHKNNILSWVLKEDPSIIKYGLINSIKYENIEAIQFLLGESALSIDINIKDRFERTPLHEAARNKLLPIAEQLIQKGANINFEDHLSNTPLHDAAKSDSKEIALLLLEKGANIEHKNQSKKTPLLQTVQFNSKNVCQLLIDSGANLEATNGGYWSSLNIAALYNSSDVAEILIKTDAPFEGEYNNYTPLHNAAYYNSKETTKVLLKKYPGMFPGDIGYETPYLWAKEYYNECILAKEYNNNNKKEDNNTHYSIDKFLFYVARSDSLTQDSMDSFLEKLIERSNDIIKIMLDNISEGETIHTKDIIYQIITLLFLIKII